MSAYELQRLDNIKRNESLLASLGLASLAKELGVGRSSTSRPSQRGVGTARKRSASSPAEPTRTSSRTRNIAPDYTGIKVEHTDGRIELASGDVVLPRSGKVVRKDAREDLPPETPIPFHRVNDDDGETDGGVEDEEDEEDKPLSARLPSARAAAALPKPDARDDALLDLIRRGQQAVADQKPSSGRGSLKGGSRPSVSASAVAGASVEALSSCELDEQMVVKVCKSAIVHLKFQPREDGQPVLAAADKEGHVSFWQCERSEEDPSDGVHLHKPHRQYVSGLVWCPRNLQAVYSSSYDGSVRCLHVERREFVNLFYSDEIEISAFTTAAAGELLWLGSNEGHLGAVDARSGQVVETLGTRRHTKKVNTLSLDSGREWLLASASSDNTVQLWDVRQFAKPIARIELPKASQAAEFAPDGSGRLAVTCFDDQLRVFDSSALSSAGNSKAQGGGLRQPWVEEPLRIKHCTQTGRWVVPFRATWTAASDGVLVGGMKRTAEVYSARTGKRLTSLSSPELMTAIPSRNAAHPDGRTIAAATNSGRVHLYRM